MCGTVTSRCRTPPSDREFINDGSVSLLAGIIMAVTGPNQLAAFFVSAWLAYVGSVFFYKAFTVTFPGVDRRFYAWLIFLFPSILFWTADVGKEADMLFALGLTAYGMAQVLTGVRRGYFFALIGGAIALLVRPNELILIVAGFAIAMIVRGLGGGQLAGETRRRRGPLSTIGAFLFVAAAVAVVGYFASHQIHHVSSNNNTGLAAPFRRCSTTTAPGQAQDSGAATSRIPRTR